MAGRRPRVPRDEAAGVSPLKGQAGAAGTGGNGAGRGGPARGYSWAPFAPGHTASLKHGVYSEPRVSARASELMAAVLADPRLPDHVRSALFEPALRAWSRAEAMAEAAWDWATAKDNPDEMFELKPGVMRSPSEVWKGLEAHAARARSRLGMDPASYAAISKDLGLANRAVEDSLQRAARQGREIAARRLGITRGSAGVGPVDGVETAAEPALEDEPLGR